MKKALAVGLILCASLATPVLAAQGEFMFGLTGGLGMPLGDYGDLVKSGFNAGVYGDYSFSETFAIGADVSYNKNGVKDALQRELEYFLVVGLLGLGATSASANVDWNSSIVQFGVYGKLRPRLSNASVAPYFRGGVSMYNVKQSLNATVTFADTGMVSTESFSESVSENKFGFNGGAGVDFKASSNVTIGVGGNFHIIMTEGSRTKYVTVGVTVGYGAGSR